MQPIFTRQYFVELFREWVTNNPSADSKLTFDEFDAVDFMEMAVSYVINEITAKRMMGVEISSFAVPYTVPVIDNKATLPFPPSTMDYGIVSVTSCEGIHTPRKRSAQGVIYDAITNDGGPHPYKLIDNQVLTWKSISAKEVEVFMVPNLRALDKTDKYILPAGVEDIVFAKAYQLAINKLRMKLDTRNNTNPNESTTK